MLVISAGMQKAGSAYLYNVINDLMTASGKADARTVKSEHRLDDILRWHNNNLAQFRPAHLVKLIRISLEEGSFAVKSHSGPTPMMKLLLKLGLIKVIYVYRDPRDVLVSAIDHGKKLLAAGEDHTFAKMVEFDKALANLRKWVRIWEEYSAMRGVLHVKYEELLTKPRLIADRICSYLRLSVNASDIDQILWKYNKENEEADMTGLHFNKARIGRYKEELTLEQCQKINDSLAVQIPRMGYALLLDEDYGR